MSTETTEAPLENDGSLGAAASLMSDVDIGGFEAPQPVRGDGGKFAKADAAGEPVKDSDPAEVAQHGDNDKPIQADTEDPDATDDSPDDKGADDGADDEEDFVEVPAAEEGAEPARYRLSELVEAHTELATTKQELERAKQAQPLPSDLEIATQETVAVRDRYAKALDQWQHYNPVGEPPNKELLNQASQYYDPDAYYQQLQAYEHRVQQHKEAKAEQERIEAENEGDRQKVLNSQLLRARDKIMEFWPELKDPAENQRVRQDLLDHYGITAERLASITDPDAFRVMKDALAFKRGEAKKPKALKAVTAKPKLVPAKARQAQKSAKAQKSADATRRLAASGSLDDAADALGDFL